MTHPTAPPHAPRLRVAFLFGHLHRGGMQKAVSNLSIALPAEWEQYVVFFGTEHPDFPYRATLVDLAVPGSEHAGALRKLSNFVRRCVRLRRFLRARHIDVVVSFGELANVLNVVAGGPRRVLSVRSSPTESLRELGAYGRLYGGLMRALYRRANVVVAVSQAIADALVRSYGVPSPRVTVIHNLVDPERIRALAREALPPEHRAAFDRPVVVAVGSLAEHKGQRHLLRAFAQALATGVDARLVLVGDGPDRLWLRADAEALGIAAAVHLVGFDPNPYRYVARARLLALPSWYEGFPNVVVEALACGVPVVATDCETGPREILGASGAGVLVPPLRRGREHDTEAALAQAIASLVTDDALHAAFAERARRRAVAFAPERIASRWVEIAETGTPHARSGGSGAAVSTYDA